MDQLEINHTYVHHQQGFLRHNSPAHHNSGGQTTTPWTSRLQKGIIMHRPQPCCPPDPWTVTWMEQLFVRGVLTLRSLLTAFTDHRSGIFNGTMEFNRSWWGLFRPCTTTLNAESYTNTMWQSPSEWTPVSSKVASRRLCSSSWQWTGSYEL